MTALKFAQDTDMLVDLKGRVRNIQLSPNRALHPVFEAIANSIYSIQDSERTDGKIDVILERSGEGEQSLYDGGDLRPISNVTIIDNGVGFTEDNFNSFNKSDSRYKLAAKGIGRLTWLIAFEAVQVESIFHENSEWYRRKFDFVLSDDGIEREKTNPIPKPADGPTTTVQLRGFKDKYRAKCEKGIQTIADKIIEYFLFYFTQPNCPNISLSDNKDSLNLNEIYQQNVKGKNQPPKEFKINDQKFEILHLQLYLSKERNHKVHFCAHSRTVTNIDATSHIPELAAKRVTDSNGTQFKYAAYVSSSYLDENVTPDRTGFNIPLSSHDLDAGDEVSFEQILEASSAKAKEFLEESLRPIRESRIKDQTKFIRNNPQFRIIQTYRPEALENLKPDLSEADLDAQLNKILFEIETDVRAETRRVLENSSLTDSASYLERFQALVEKVTNVSQSKLAQHVIHRKVILDLLKEQLKMRSDGKYERESVIHQTIFPRWKTSDEVLYDDQNLWILDERLAYHTFLASDRAISTYKVLKSKDGRKPDIVIFGESESPYDSVVIIEFKRPMREGYTDEDPIRKLFEIADSIRSSDSDIVDDEGRPIKTHAASRIYCYLICDLVADQIVQHAKMNRLTPTPDGEAYYGYHPEFEASMEVIDYNRLVKDAVKRNRILFTHLGVNP